ncbi:MAG TPA: O-phospho-L-seryl-tRNA:Cys-tRNA synthase [Candidatus Lokiarchaeia archaeon]|nr:O-phospho-L-seryl-tRNA:Cys-tRNA synthase [Candidatus Lokiarchaeia archaeon]
MDIIKDELRKFQGLLRENSQDQYINLQPIQRGGILPPESKKTLLSFGDGYSMCDFCLKGRLDMIEKPAISQFLQLFARWVDMDVSMPTGASRQAKKIILQQLASKVESGVAPVLVVDALAHYSTYVAAESAGVEIVEVPHEGYPDFKIDPDKYAETIDQARDDRNKQVIAALITHADYLYGNITSPEAVGKICKDKGVPFIVNGAYTVGIMPFSGRQCGADFVTASGHKSMASSGPIGMLSCSAEYQDLLFPRSSIKGNWSGRTFKRKITTLIGCPSVYGAPLATLMSSFAHVVERTRPENWEREKENARLLADALLRIDGVKMLGMQPHEHTLMQFETKPFMDVANNAPKKGFFLYNELKTRGIVGIFPGMVKSMKLNTYGLTTAQVEHVAKSFIEIAEKYGCTVN